uniref:hypothetical protein n=1 Tax=Alloprevotella sp. TaxID=1872471 RepID=UPI00402A5B21
MKRKKLFFFSLPSRSLSYSKMQGERNEKEKAFFLFITEPQPILFKDARRA